MISPDSPARGRESRVRCRTLALGGLPIVVDGEVIGGIGASFATPEDDEQVARAGLAALSKQLESGACFGP